MNRGRALATAGLSLVVLLGVGLVVYPALRGASPKPPSNAGPSDERHYRAVLTPWPDGGAPDLPALLADELHRYGEVAVFQGSWRMTRIVREGFEYDSRIAVELVRQGGTARVDLAVSRNEAVVARYRAAVERDGPIELEMAQGAGEDFERLSLGDAAPVSLGDVRIRDLTDLYDALDEHRVRALGSLGNQSSIDLAVFEIDLRPPVDAGGTDARNEPLAGVHALLYCDAYDLTPRTLRVFDAAGRMVRLYTGFAFEPTGAAGDDPGDLRLTAFRVDSPPLGSSTTVRVVAMESANAAAGQRGAAPGRSPPGAGSGP